MADIDELLQRAQKLHRQVHGMTIRGPGWSGDARKGFIFNAADVGAGEDTTPPTPTGACCVDEDCSIATEADCDGAGGVYQGDGTTCSPNPCTEEVDCCVNLPTSWTIDVTLSGTFDPGGCPDDITVSGNADSGAQDTSAIMCNAIPNTWQASYEFGPFAAVDFFVNFSPHPEVKNVIVDVFLFCTSTNWQLLLSVPEQSMGTFTDPPCTPSPGFDLKLESAIPLLLGNDPVGSWSTSWSDEDSPTLLWTLNVTVS